MIHSNIWRDKSKLIYINNNSIKNPRLQERAHPVATAMQNKDLPDIPDWDTTTTPRGYSCCPLCSDALNPRSTPPLPANSIRVRKAHIIECDGIHTNSSVMRHISHSDSSCQDISLKIGARPSSVHTNSNWSTSESKGGVHRIRIAFDKLNSRHCSAGTGSE